MSYDREGAVSGAKRAKSNDAVSRARARRRRRHPAVAVAVRSPAAARRPRASNTAPNDSLDPSSPRAGTRAKIRTDFHPRSSRIAAASRRVRRRVRAPRARRRRSGRRPPPRSPMTTAPSASFAPFSRGFARIGLHSGHPQLDACVARARATLGACENGHCVPPPQRPRAKNAHGLDALAGFDVDGASATSRSMGTPTSSSREPAASGMPRVAVCGARAGRERAGRERTFRCIARTKGARDEWTSYDAK